MKNKLLPPLVWIALLLITNSCFGQNQSATPKTLTRYEQERSNYYRDQIVPVMTQVLSRIGQALSVEESAQITAAKKHVYSVKTWAARDTIEASVKPIVEKHQELISEIQKELAVRRAKWLADLTQIQLLNNEPPIPVTSTKMTDKMILENYARPWMLLINATSASVKSTSKPKTN
jgi:hypothetical protein